MWLAWSDCDNCKITVTSSAMIFQRGQSSDPFLSWLVGRALFKWPIHSKTRSPFCFHCFLLRLLSVRRTLLTLNVCMKKSRFHSNCSVKVRELFWLLSSLVLCCFGVANAFTIIWLANVVVRLSRFIFRVRGAVTWFPWSSWNVLGFLSVLYWDPETWKTVDYDSIISDAGFSGAFSS